MIRQILPASLQLLKHPIKRPLSRCISVLAQKEEVCIKQHLEDLDVKGFTILPEIFTPEEVKDLQADYLKVKQKAFNIINNVAPSQRIWVDSGKELQSRYWKTDKELIMQAGVGRYDCYKGFSRDILPSWEHPLVTKIMREVLVRDFTTYQGVILSDGHNEGQYWHRDVRPLQNRRSCGKEMVLLDDFLFTILIPCMVDVTPENGPTEFYSGSHRQSTDEFDDSSIEQVCAPLGSALLFNGKLYHRGMPNTSGVDRPVIYQMYHKKWYNDWYRAGVEGHTS